MKVQRAFAWVVSTVGLAAAAGVSWLLACGPFLDDYKTVEKIAPPHLAEYAGGQLGVVRPNFARRFLVQAYRSSSGRTPLDDALKTAADVESARFAQDGAFEQWKAARQQVFPGTLPPAHKYWSTSRDIGNYQYIHNCQDDAFATAARTLNDRVSKYGASSAAAQDWLRAQDAVFSNCGGGPLTVPQPAPPSADARARADRAYQTAAAHFYATEYLEAARLFRAIGQDTSSPWRAYGRYLAARSLLRQATVREKDAAAASRLAEAQSEFKAILSDPLAKPLHPSTRGLLDFIAARLQPIDRLRQLSSALVAEGPIAIRDIVDYQVMMDRIVGDTTVLDGPGFVHDDALVASGDLTDWIVTIQTGGHEAAAHALQRWKATKSMPWLLAAAWKVPARHVDAGAVLAAAQPVPRTSPAFATLAFLRVRLLAARGATDEARRLLATLPREPEPGFPPETINLFAAERFMLATSFEELLANATRRIVVEGDGFGRPSFDEDAGRVLSERLPLARLIDASLATTLPDRLRVRVAGAAFTRALLLRRYHDARRVLPVLERLAPSMQADLARFTAAKADDDRHVAGVLTLLRTPGLHTYVRGMDDSQSYPLVEPSRELEHTFRRNWWCDLHHRQSSDLLPLLYGTDEAPQPSFVTVAERKAAEDERWALNRIGPAPNYLAAEAVKWARARPTDPDMAEALARAVQGTRWGCGDDKTSNASRLAFQTLHRLFPESEWTRRTRYWY
jgi:hypothetical protein